MASYKHIRLFYPVWLWGIFISVISLLPGKTMPEVSLWDWIAVDKLGHFTVYAVWAIFLHRAFFQSGEFLNKKLVLGLASIILHGVLLEILQWAMYLGRFFEFSDIVANCIGVLGGTGTYFFFLKRF
jgi:VanZ family protein